MIRPADESMIEIIVIALQNLKQSQQKVNTMEFHYITARLLRCKVFNVFCHHTNRYCWHCTHPCFVHINIFYQRCRKVSQVTASQQTKGCEHTNTHTLVHSAHMLTQRKQRHVYRQAQRDATGYKDRKSGPFWVIQSTLDLR